MTIMMMGMILNLMTGVYGPGQSEWMLASEEVLGSHGRGHHPTMVMVMAVVAVDFGQTGALWNSYLLPSMRATLHFDNDVCLGAKLADISPRSQQLIAVVGLSSARCSAKHLETV